MKTSIPRLILHPRDYEYIPDNRVAILQQLETVNFINQSIINSGLHLAGDDFSNLLTFLGCSPEINLSPEDGDNFCSIAVSEVHENSILLGYTSTSVPRCPECNHKIRDWKQHFHHWKKGEYIYTCSECQANTSVTKLKWRQEGGYGRFCIAINHIHPHEAVPAEKLLNALQQVSHTEWTYFYATN